MLRWRMDEWIEYLDPEKNRQPCHTSKKYDLFDWATWMWRVMMNHHSWSRGPWIDEPLFHVNTTTEKQLPFNVVPAKDNQYRRQPDEQPVWPLLEEQRLGHVFVKAWNAEYEDAAEVIHDVKAVVKSMGMTLVGDDEIDIGVEWDKVFMINGVGREKELHFASPPTDS